MSDFIAILRDSGVAVADKRVRPHDGAFHPVGVVVHHTATKGPGLSTVQKGRPDLAGPLCNLNLTRLAQVNVVSDGVAWHAGPGSGRVLADVKADKAPTGDAKARGLKDDASGNAWFVGIEVDNDGVGERYPDAQITALAKTCAALCHHFGWTANRVIHHREWTARKIDMSYHGDLRGAVAALLGTTQEDDMTPEQAKQLDTVRTEVHNIQEAIGQRLNGTISDVLARIDKLEAGGGQVDVDALATAVADKIAARLKD